MLYNDEINRLKATEKVMSIRTNPIHFKVDHHSFAMKNKIEVVYSGEFNEQPIERRIKLDYPFRNEKHCLRMGFPLSFIRDRLR